MNIAILGAAGFIGTNLTLCLMRNSENHITLIDKKRDFFQPIIQNGLENVDIVESEFGVNENYEKLVQGQDIVYHLVSTSVPSTSNKQVSEELTSNVVMTSILLEACARCNVKKIVFISSGGTVYGTEVKCPLSEDTPLKPITSYGLQKVAIEKLLYLYYYMYGLDYRIVRLANPYGPYQRPNGILGAVTTFTFKALKNEEIVVYGDGSVVRDFIYIDDAIRGILNIVDGCSSNRTFNLGCGYGTSIKDLLGQLEEALDIKVKVKYTENRKVDVPVNYLDISRYEKAYGSLNPVSLIKGIQMTAAFMRKEYKI